MHKRDRPPMAVFGFLLPNFLGFVAFTLFPVLLSLWMAFTNWTLKPAVAFEVLGLRNFTDLLGVRALADPRPGLVWGYAGSVAAFCAGLVGVLWANVAGWRGVKPGGLVLGLLGLVVVAEGLAHGGGQGIVIAGLLALVCGAAVAWREEGEWRPGPGTVPALVLAAGALGLWLLNDALWRAYEPRDARFWQYFYNTVYLMLG